MDSFVVTKSITISAERDKVWEALTNPEITKKYFFHCKVFSTWRPGDPITFKGRLFFIKKIELTGKILKVIPGKFLRYTLFNNQGDRNSSTSTITDELTSKNEETTLTISDDVGTGPGAEKRYNKSMKGWDKVLKGLKKLLES